MTNCPKNHQYTYWEPKGYFENLFAGQIDQIFNTHWHFLRFTPFLCRYMTNFLRKSPTKDDHLIISSIFIVNHTPLRQTFGDVTPLEQVLESKTASFKVGFSYCGSSRVLAPNSLIPQGTCTFLGFSDLVRPKRLATFNI